MDSWDEEKAGVVVEFLEVAIHALLHTRGVYPQGEHSCA